MSALQSVKGGGGGAGKSLRAVPGAGCKSRCFQQQPSGSRSTECSSLNKTQPKELTPQRAQGKGEHSANSPWLILLCPPAHGSRGSDHCQTQGVGEEVTPALLDEIFKPRRAQPFPLSLNKNRQVCCSIPRARNFDINNFSTVVFFSHLCFFLVFRGRSGRKFLYF